MYMYMYKVCTYMYLWFMRCLHVCQEFIKVNKSVGKHLEAVTSLGVVDEHNGDVVHVAKVGQL